MKTRLSDLLATVAFAILMCGCGGIAVDEIIDDDPLGSWKTPVTFSATIGDDTRAVVQGSKVLWEAGDAIGVFVVYNDDNNKTKTSSLFKSEPLEEGGESANFQIVPSTEEEAAILKKATGFYAVFPFGKGERVSKTSDGDWKYIDTYVRYPMGYEQTYGNAQKAVAYSSDHTLSFININHLVKFNVSDENVVKAVLAPLSGQAYISADHYYVSPETKAFAGNKDYSDLPVYSTSISLEVKTGDNYFSIMPGITLEGGFTISLYDASGDETGRFTYEADGGFKTRRNTITTIDIFEGRLETRSNLIKGHEYVEMGDGLKWATMNLGAMNPYSYGDYFGWAEPTSKQQNYEVNVNGPVGKDFNWINYRWIKSGKGDMGYINKYQLDDGNYPSVSLANIWYSYYMEDGKKVWVFTGDGRRVVKLEDDAARQNWGGSWRIPTKDEFKTLCDPAKFEWTYDKTRKGFTVTSKIPGYEGNNIFFPAAGRINLKMFWDKGEKGFYWSSSLTNETYSACDLEISQEDGAQLSEEGQWRSFGLPIRAVSD